MLSYLGCFCGFLGSGRALDGIDRCCKAHDYCYTSANCLFYTEYFVPYLWKCYRGKPLCGEYQIVVKPQFRLYRNYVNQIFRSAIDNGGKKLQIDIICKK